MSQPDLSTARGLLVVLPAGSKTTQAFSSAVMDAIAALRTARLSLVADCREQVARPDMSTARVQDRKRLLEEHSRAMRDVSDALLAEAEAAGGGPK